MRICAGPSLPGNYICNHSYLYKEKEKRFADDIDIDNYKIAVFIQKTKFSSRRKVRLKLFFVYQYKHGKKTSDRRILRRKFRLNLCVETTHKLKQFSRLNYKGKILSVPYLYRRNFRLDKIPSDFSVLAFIQSKISSQTIFSSRRKFRLLYKYSY